MFAPVDLGYGMGGGWTNLKEFLLKTLSRYIQCSEIHEVNLSDAMHLCCGQDF